MNLPFRFARRYLFSKKSTNAINVISGVSMTGMAVGSMALVLVLSVFNGFESLVISLYDAFYPEIRITSVEGKTFVIDATNYEELKQVEGVSFVSQVLEEKALLKFKEREEIASLKGVDADYVKVTGLESHIIRGEFILEDERQHYAVIGKGVEAILGLNIESIFTGISVFIPRRGATIGMSPDRAFNRKMITPSGVFEIQQEFDSKYVIVPIQFMRDLLQYENEISAIEIKTTDYDQVYAVQERLQLLMGDDFLVENRYQQNRFLYSVMKTEKWAVFAILSFILMIAAFNIVGSLTMLVIEKSKDISILKAMGASAGLIRNIFLMEGIMMAMIGALSGILLATIISLIQIYFEVVKIQGSGTFVIDSYPVQINPMDYLMVLIIVTLISVIASWVPAQRAAKQSWIILEE